MVTKAMWCPQCLIFVSPEDIRHHRMKPVHVCQENNRLHELIPSPRPQTVTPQRMLEEGRY